MREFSQSRQGGVPRIGLAVTDARTPLGVPTDGELDWEDDAWELPPLMADSEELATQEHFERDPFRRQCRAWIIKTTSSTHTSMVEAQTAGSVVSSSRYTSQASPR